MLLALRLQVIFLVSTEGPISIPMFPFFKEFDLGLHDVSKDGVGSLDVGVVQVVTAARVRRVEAEDDPQVEDVRVLVVLPEVRVDVLGLFVVNFQEVVRRVHGLGFILLVGYRKTGSDESAH